MKPFKKIDLELDVTALQHKLVDHPEYFGIHNARVVDKSPHRESEDIWVRYNDVAPYNAGEKDFSKFNNEHDSVWYDIADELPGIKDISNKVMKEVQGESLGGVLITKLQPGQRVYPHKDFGWHAEYYDKFYVPIMNKTGAVFHFKGGDIKPEEGDVYQFNNQVAHWVTNKSHTIRIALVICIRTKNTMLNNSGGY